MKSVKYFIATLIPAIPGSSFVYAKRTQSPWWQLPLFSLAKRLYPCRKIASGRSTSCWQTGQVRDQWLSLRFWAAGVIIVLCTAVTALKDNKNCLCNCGRLYYCSGDAFPGRLLMAYLTMWLALVNTMRVKWHLSLPGRGFKSQCTVSHTPYPSLLLSYGSMSRWSLPQPESLRYFTEQNILCTCSTWVRIILCC